MWVAVVTGRYATDHLLLLQLKCLTKALTTVFVVTGGTVVWTEVVLGSVPVVILVMVLVMVVVAAGAIVLVPALMVVVSLTGLGVVKAVAFIAVVTGVAVAVICGGLVGVTSGAALVISRVDVASAVGDVAGSVCPIVPPAGEAADGSGVNVGADDAVPVVINGSTANMDVDA